MTASFTSALKPSRTAAQWGQPGAMSNRASGGELVSKFKVLRCQAWLIGLIGIIQANKPRLQFSTVFARVYFSKRGAAGRYQLALASLIIYSTSSSVSPVRSTKSAVQASSWAISRSQARVMAMRGGS